MYGVATIVLLLLPLGALLICLMERAAFPPQSSGRVWFSAAVLATALLSLTACFLSDGDDPLIFFGYFGLLISSIAAAFNIFAVLLFLYLRHGDQP